MSKIRAAEFALLALIIAGSASAQIAGPAAAAPPALEAKANAAATLVAPTPIVDEARQELLRQGQAWTRFSVAQHGEWHVDFDLASGRPRRMLGNGIPLLPGRLSNLTLGDLPPTAEGPVRELTPAVLEAVAKRFLAANRELFRINPDEWRIEVSDSPLLDNGNLQYIDLHRYLGSAQVRYARIHMAVKFGKLIYLHATFLDDMLSATVPALSAEDALAIAVAGVDPTTVSVADKAALELVPVALADGHSRDFKLVWTVMFRVDGFDATWRAEVDAQNGEIVGFRDDNKYACRLDPTLLQGRAEGGIKPAQASDAEVVRFFPYTRVVDSGTPKTTDYNGWYSYSGGNAQSTLGGTFFNVSCNGCTAQPLASNNTSGYLDFGTGGVDGNSNGMSTPADRTAFYHLNVARGIGTKWVNLGWYGTNVLINTNINQNCNAFWNGSSLNFFRSGGGCSNTGEIRDVMQHEWGHGMDKNDGVQPAEGGTGEAYGDHIALFVDHDSCVGASFWASSTGPYCINTPDCTTTAACTGVRNIDEKRTVANPSVGNAGGLMSIATASTWCSPSGGCKGPLNLECHCEGEIWGQAEYHLAINLLTGKAYDTCATAPNGCSSGTPIPGANPAFSEAAAWYILEKLFFQSTPTFASYAPSTRQSFGPSAYDAFMVIDDDNANLNDGTPDAAYINQAYKHHGIDELPNTIDSANCTPPADPVVTLTPLIGDVNGNNQVKVTWPDVNANFYNVYRTERIGDAWLLVRQNILDNNAPYTVIDEPVANGLRYYYSVLAVSNTGCVSPGNNTQNVLIRLPEIGIVANTVTDPAPGGNNDGFPDPGESVKIRVNLQELGGVLANNVSATLHSDDPLVAVTGPGPVVYGNFAASQTVNGPSDFTLYITLGHGCGTDIPLKLLISSDDGCWIRGLKISIPIPCSAASRAEAAYSSASVNSDSIDPACTDNDKTLDNDETARLNIVVKNAGSLPASNVQATLGTTSPYVTILSANPQVLPGQLAAGGTGTLSFDVKTANAPCRATADFTVSVNAAENVSPIVGAFSLVLEEDRGVGPLAQDFESGFGTWTANGFVISSNHVAGGTKSAWAGTAPATGHCDGSGSTDGGNTCASLISPVVTPTATSTFALSTWYQIEPSGPPGSYWDRANVHVIDGFTHAVITPTSGRSYNVPADAYTGLCHLNTQPGWDGNATSFAVSTFNLAAYAGKDIQVEINYNTDAAEICEGLYVDNVNFTNLTMKTCDVKVCAPSANVVLESCTAVDSCPAPGAGDGDADPGDTVTYTMRFRNQGAAASSGFQADVASVAGGTVTAGATVGGAPVVNIPAAGFYDHTATVSVTGACGSTLDMSVNNMRDASATFGNNAVLCDKPVGQPTCNACVAPKADVVVESCNFSDLCTSSGNTDGQVDPGDTLTYTVRFKNQGTVSSSNFQANVVAAAGGNVTAGATVGGAPVVNIPAGGTYDHSATVDVTGVCGNSLNIDITNLRDGGGSFSDNLAACDRAIGGTTPAGNKDFTISANSLIPDDPNQPLWSSNNVSEPNPVNTASVNIVVNHPSPSDLGALLYGPKGGKLDVTAAINGNLDISALYAAEGPGVWTLKLFDGVTNKKRGTLVSWKVNVAYPQRSSCTTCAAPSCTPPSLNAKSTKVSVCPGTYTALSADVVTPGVGAFTYTWDFGDLSPTQDVVSPTSGVPHLYATVGNYTARITATAVGNPTCTTNDTVLVSVQKGTAPTGSIGNVLRAIKSNTWSAYLSWAGATVTPPSYNVHKTTTPAEVVETPAGIADEPILATTAATFLTDINVLKVFPALDLYKVMPADTCGSTVTP